MHADRHEFSCLYYVLVRYWHNSIQSCPIKCQTFICYRCMCRFSCSQFSSARITLLYHREAVYNWPYPRLSHCMMFTATKPYKQSCSIPTTTTSCHCKPCELVAVRGTQPNLLQEGGYHTVWCFTLGCHTIWCLQPPNLTSKAAVSQLQPHLVTVSLVSWWLWGEHSPIFCRKVAITLYDVLPSAVTLYDVYSH